jgi:hypothetical protein
MAISIRPITASDYDNILLKWWNDWEWVAPHRDFLPADGEGGLIVFDGDEPVCAGYMYTTNSKVAWVDWIISSKTYRKKPTRKECIDLLIYTLTSICKSTDHKYVYALIKNRNLIGTYQKFGYIQGDSYTGEMIKVL